jgi:uncharacterized phosphosugar-binding protein
VAPSKRYFSAAKDLLDSLEAAETEKIRKAASLMADSIMNGGIPHIFGSGHSRIPAKEVFIRAGTLSCLRAMGVNQDLDRFERIEGVAQVLLNQYALQANDMLIVISNSGINPLPIELAMGAKQAGLPVVALTSMAHSQTVPSRHSSGKRLFEVVDLVIDTHVPPGDAAIELEGLPAKVGPLSTLSGVAIMDAMVVDTIAEIISRGGEPPVRISRNMPGGDENNRRFKEKYGNRIPEL